MREAPSIPLVTALQDMGARVRAFDPVGMEQARTILPEVTFCDGPYTCADGAVWGHFISTTFAGC
jgi:UDPglucose 6-dehydrogenase